MKKLLTILLLALALAGCQPEKVSKGAMFNAPKEPTKGWYMKDAPKLPLDRYEPKSGMWNDATIPPIRGNPPTNFWLEIVHA
jgi:PBP1b-binding outer membrane lipoprotein LpoB